MSSGLIADSNEICLKRQLATRKRDCGSVVSLSGWHCPLIRGLQRIALVRSMLFVVRIVKYLVMQLQQVRRNCYPTGEWGSLPSVHFTMAERKG